MGWGLPYCPVGRRQCQADGRCPGRRDQIQYPQLRKSRQPHTGEGDLPYPPTLYFVGQQQTVTGYGGQHPFQQQKTHSTQPLDQRKRQLDQQKHAAEHQWQKERAALAAMQQKGIGRQRDNGRRPIDDALRRTADHQAAEKCTAYAPQPMRFGQCQPIAQAEGTDAAQQAGIGQQKGQQKMSDAAVFMINRPQPVEYTGPYAPCLFLLYLHNLISSW